MAEHIVYLETPMSFFKTATESLPKCELRDSPGKGKGVFMLEPVKKGRYVTVYPSHVVFRCCVDLNEDVNGTEQEFDTIGHMRGVEITDEKFAKYSLGAKYKNLLIMGDPSYCRPRALGHMINDKARSKNVKDEGIYTNISTRGQNVTPETLFIEEDESLPVIFMKATRDIEANEELFYSYGLNYWRPKRQKSDKAQSSDKFPK